VAAWLTRIQAAAGASAQNHTGSGAFGASTDWLLTLIAQISGETPSGVGDELRLSEDLHLDSLGRVPLAAEIEERLGVATENGLWEHVQTLGDLRRLLASEPESAQAAKPRPGTDSRPGIEPKMNQRADEMNAEPEPWPAAPAPPPPSANHLYPHWPWWPPFRWLRIAFIEAVMRPLVWLLTNPAVVPAASGPPQAEEPMLIIANHVTSFDAPFLEYALPGPIRRRMAVAMSGEMLEDYRHFRNPERATAKAGFYPPGPAIYLLITALFNVFPLPRQRDFQRSFAHAGEALDRGMHVLLFPEGTRSAEGSLARFRPGIGLLVKQSAAPVLPMAIRGLGELKTGRRRWFRSGTIEVCIGDPMRFSPADSEAPITAQLHAAVEKLLEEQGTGNREQGTGNREEGIGNRSIVVIPVNCKPR
jgi:long-chain acyl-CoA synthetase